MRIQNMKMNRGFTLVETLVAVAILAMAIGAMYSTWMAVVRATQSGERATSQIQRERVALATMEQAMSCAVVYFNEKRQQQGMTNAYSFVAEDVDGFKTVSFVARLPEDFLGSASFPNQPVRRVLLQVEPTANGSNELVMRQWALARQERAAEEGDDGLRIVLASHVDVFQLRFWGNVTQEYVDFWDQPESLPDRMRIFLALRDEGEEQASEEALNMRELVLAAPLPIDEVYVNPPRKTPSRGGAGAAGINRQQIMAKFDKNGNGQLDPEERRALMEFARKNGFGRDGGPVRAVRPVQGGGGGAFRGEVVGPGGKSGGKRK
ncbi:MAG: hypothetical protein CMO74_13445 [Verrucomicrobiales bacterium]|nr:hypothetical protein [Verrucomicrobiales bacterium]|tara:strand:+ start:15061 stop:16023 length:963 start_codon:yes stop_codon:yes gene_type:complete